MGTLKRLDRAAAKAAIQVIVAYQKVLGPLKKPCCRYYPSCSRYAMDALEKYGIVRGGMMALWRVLRCNPFSRGGYDPVR